MSKKITKSATLAVIDVLSELYMAHDMHDVLEVYKRMQDKYNIYDDPFTGFPTTEEEFFNNREELNKQRMEEKYDYWE